jgi:hypothetical protein
MSIDPPHGQIDSGDSTGGKFYSSQAGGGALLRFVRFP